MKRRLLTGTAAAVLGFALFSHAGSAATLDDVMRRLDKLEKENADLRRQVRTMSDGRGKAAPAVAAAPAAKANPVVHGAVATSPAPASTVAGLAVKAGPLGPLVDNTTVTIYGHFDLSADVFNPSVFDQGTKWGVASNGSYFGVRARHNLAPYGYEGYSIVAQMEAQIDAASAPTERAALGTRDSYLGVEGPWGAIKGGKSDTPYKKATAAFDPFANTLGDYNSIMGNTGGDNRAEFDWRMNHAIWYESPIWNGFQFSALVSPGQNYANDNSAWSYGDYFQCNGTSARGSGSGFNNGNPNTIGSGECTDGSFGDAYSVAGVYKNGPWTAMAAYEMHQGVNRTGDNGVVLPDGSVSIVDIRNEWAAKVGGGYRFYDGLGDLQLYAYYEWLRRDVPAALQAWNERSRDGVFASATQFIGNWSFSASYAHAFSTPGNPAALSVNDPVLAPLATLQGNLFDDSASMYAIGTRYRFNQWASWYLVGAVLTQGPGAHYCLGPSGHGYAVCSRDAANDTIGGATIWAATTGLTFDF